MRVPKIIGLNQVMILQYKPIVNFARDKTLKLGQRLARNEQVEVVIGRKGYDLASLNCRAGCPGMGKVMDFDTSLFSEQFPAAIGTASSDFAARNLIDGNQFAVIHHR